MTHVSYIGPESWVEMTDAMVEPFKERFTEDCNRVPSQTVAALIESSVGKQMLLPDTLFARRSTLMRTNSATYLIVGSRD